MSTRAVGLVARREIEQRVRGRAFLFGTLAIVVLVVAATLLPTLGAGDDDSLEVGLVGREPAALAAALGAGAESVGATVEPRRFETLAAGEGALRDGEIGVLVVDGRSLVWKAEPDDRLQSVAGGALQRLQWQKRAAELGLSVAQAQALLVPQPAPEQSLQSVDADRDARYAAALLGLVLLSVTLSFYGQAVANGVAQEKGTRVMEVLLARVPARELLVGKVLGVGVIGLAQLVIACAAALVTVAAFDEIEVPSAVPSVVGWVILWFVLGYAFYSVVYAALGALVSRAEDVESVQAPLGFFIMGCLLIALYATDSPDAALVHLASLAPPTAPFVMPVRAAVSDVAVWEVVLSAALMLAATYAVIRFAAAVYEGAVLRTGGGRSVTDVWRAARAARTGAD
jgi:ABC-2 type transport system permease protein